MHLSMLSRRGGRGRPGIGGGFDSSHRPVVGAFDRFNGLSRNILLTFSCYFDNPQMPWDGAFEQKLSAQFKCPAYAPPPPQQLNIDRCIIFSWFGILLRSKKFNYLPKFDRSILLHLSVLCSFSESTEEHINFRETDTTPLVHTSIALIQPQVSQTHDSRNRSNN